MRPPRVAMATPARMSVAVLPILLLLAGCGDERAATQPPPAPTGPLLSLRLAPVGPVWVVDSTHAVVGEGDWALWPQIWCTDSTKAGDVTIEWRAADAAPSAPPLSSGHVPLCTGRRDLCEQPLSGFRLLNLRDNDIAEPDREFVLSLKDPPDGLRVDPVLGAIRILVLDDDDVVPIPATFEWPLSGGAPVRFAYTKEFSYAGGNPLGALETGEATVNSAPCTFDGQPFTRLTGLVGDFLVRKEGTAFLLVPFGSLADPPGDESFPWDELRAACPLPWFDAATPHRQAPRTYGWGTDEDSVRCTVENLGTKKVATPAGVFTAQCVEMRTCTIWDYYYIGRVTRRFYIADSIGIVAYRETLYGQGQTMGFWSSVKYAAIVALPLPGTRSPRQPTGDSGS